MLSVLAVLAAVATQAHAADCQVGIYRTRSGEAVVVVPAADGAGVLNYRLVDGRRGRLGDPSGLLACEHGALSGRGGLIGLSFAYEAQRETPTRFRSGALVLNGRLIEPAHSRGKPPLVVMVHGSERSGAVGSSPYPYLLTAQGVSTLVFDKRGTGRSQGVYTQDFAALADDVVAASAEAKRLAKGRYGRFGLFGGSQGGWVAPAAANRARADFVAIGFGLILSPLEEDSEQVFDELRRKGYGEDVIAKARDITGATDAVMTSNFTSGYDRLEAVKARYGQEPWFAGINGEFTGELLRTDETTLRRDGPARFNDVHVPWRYDAVAALRRLHMPQLWVFAGADREAPGALSRTRLLELARGGRPIDAYVFPDTDHGIFEFTEAADGTRTITRQAEGYQRLLADWMKGELKPPYGRAQVIARAGR
jgi:pimeloyl-ACP methyl ester carboxylesterase